MSAMLITLGSALSAIHILTPERLTTLTMNIANRNLNADVSIGRMEVSLRGTFPFLTLTVDDFTITSRDIKNLPEAQRASLPQWADTLASAQRMSGGINIYKMLRSKIDLHNLEITAPEFNLLIVNENLNNFSIMPPTDDKVTDKRHAKLPDIRLNRFHLIHPRDIHYANLAQNTIIDIDVESADLRNTSGTPGNPFYNISFNTNLESPSFANLGRKAIPFALNGTIEWQHEHPYNIRLCDFDFDAWGLSGSLDTDINFFNRLTVDSFRFAFTPTPVKQLLGMVPPDVRKEHPLLDSIATNAVVTFSGTLQQPYILGASTLPLAALDIKIPECSLTAEDLDIESLETDINVMLAGGTIDGMYVKVPHFHAKTSYGEVTVNGTFSRFFSDPTFNGKITGDVVLDSLPKVITNNLSGSMSGSARFDTSLALSESMWSRDGFHRIKIDGDMSLDNYYYVADDTMSMYYVRHCKAVFGTNQPILRIETPHKNHSMHKIAGDTLLRAGISIDSAYMLVSGFDVKASGLSLDGGASDSHAASDTTAVIPMHGNLKIRDISMQSVTDSVGMQMGGINGSLAMLRYRGKEHLPDFLVDAAISSFNTGGSRTRFIANDGHIKVEIAKTAVYETAPESDNQKIGKAPVHPKLSRAQVYRHIRDIKIRQEMRHHHRVHPGLDSKGDETLIWGTSTPIKHLLKFWKIQGDITAGSGRLFMKHFPIHNKVEDINFTFDNDSLIISNVKYKAGRSDFLISGRISNMVKAFTEYDDGESLRMQLEMHSQLIDVNEIATALFAGAARDAKTYAHHVAQPADTVHPILIPNDIDARFSIQAKEVQYSDIRLQDVSGTLLMYDGALNVHDLCASSQMGALNLNALYSAPRADAIDFGFGLKLDRFNIGTFLDLVPAVDTIMPLMRDFSGIVDAQVAATSRVDSHMNLVIPSLQAAIRISGSDIVARDIDQFRTINKWLFFGDSKNDIIDHFCAEMLIKNSTLQVFPFLLDINGSRLGVQGSNNIDMDFDYHIAVLHSRVPFRFGVNIFGNPEKYHLKIGRAHFNEEKARGREPIVESTRINLVNRFEDVFRHGIQHAHFAYVDISDKPLAQEIDLGNDSITKVDSLYLRQLGILPYEKIITR